MRRKSLAMLFVTMLMLSTVLLVVSPVAAASYLLCKVDPDSGSFMDPVTVTGEIYPRVAGHVINVYWDVAAGTPIATAVTKTDGTFETTFNVPAAPAGIHAVWAVDTNTGAYCKVDFEVVPNVKLCPFCGQYCDDINVLGTGFAAETDVYWEIAWASGTEETDETGSWTTTFHVDDYPPGVYLFWAEDMEMNYAEAEFMLGPVLILDRDHGQPCEYIDVEGCLPGVPAGTTVYIYFDGLDPCIYPNGRILVGEGEILSPCGYFEGEFHVPCVPTDEYIVNATDEYETVWATAWFWVCPCIHIDPVEGQVGDTITVYGNGYAADSEVTVWMSGLLPTGVPLEAIVSLCELVNLVWAWDETNTWLIVTVGYFLPVATATTDCYGNFEVEFEIPECWGGYHPIAATDDEDNANIIGGWHIAYPCDLVFPDGILCPHRCSLVVNKPGILRVLPKIWTEPACGVSGQTITLYGTGLSAFELYVRYTDIDHDKCPDIIEFCAGEIFAYLRCSGFVLDFGPNKRWIDGPYFPNMGEMVPCDLWHELHLGHYILNGQYDEAWGRASETTWNSYSPLMLNPRGTLVSDGMSFAIALGVDYFEELPGDFCDRFSVTLAFAWEYRQVGCPFLTVPWLQPQTCELVAYRFDYVEIEFHAQWPGQDVLDLTLEFFTYDYDETATSCFTIECLKVDTDVECPECPEVDLSEIEARLAALEGDLDALMAQLSALDAKITGLITDAEGNIIARIETAEGTITSKLSALDAKIVSLSESVVTVQTALGQVQVSLDDLNAYITVDLASKLATIKTDLGTIEGKLVSMEGRMTTIETDLGTVTDKADLIVNHTGSMPVTIALSLIAAIAAIAAAVLILRKVYIA